MTTNESQPSLVTYLALEPTRQVLRSRLIGGPYLTFGSFLSLCAYLYENSALISRAKRDKLFVLEKILGRPPQPGQLVAKLKQMAKERLASFGGSPTSFFSFIIETELKKLGLSLSPPHPKVMKAFSEKLPFKKAALFIEMWTTEGFGFGAAFPDLTEQMYRRFHENIDKRDWADAKAAGLSLPESPTVIRLEEQEQTALAILATYAREYHSELVEPLGLSGR